MLIWGAGQDLSGSRLSQREIPGHMIERDRHCEELMKPTTNATLFLFAYSVLSCASPGIAAPPDHHKAVIDNSQSPGGAVRVGDYKLLEYFENGSVQLFDLSKDIGEQNDLSEAMPEKVAQLRAMLHDWREEGSAQSMQPNPTYTRKNGP